MSLSIIYSTLLSLFLSGLIGWEREREGKTVGFRDSMLICLGATFIAIFILKLTTVSKSVNIDFDLIRGIAYYMVALGFIGNGIINKQRSEEGGITTGALILPLAIMGFFSGFGEYLMASFIGVVLFLVLKLKYFTIKIKLGRKNKRRKTKKTRRKKK